MATKFKPLAMGFHSHLYYSLDGSSSAASKILNASRQGRIADCVTDHGIMSGLASHQFAAQKLYKEKKTPTKIKSIHGVELYVVDEHRPVTVFKNGKREPQYYHLTVHFKTQRAYEYFCQMTPIMADRAVVKWGETKPLIYLKELEPVSGEITIGSGCLVGPIMKNVMAGRLDLAEEMYEYIRNLAGPGNFFVELFPHLITHNWERPVFDAGGFNKIKDGLFVPATQRQDEDAIDPPFEPDPCTGLIDLQKTPNLFVRMMAKKHNDPIVISLDDHYATIEDKLIQEVRLGNGKESWKFFGSYNAKTSDECACCFKEQLGVEDKEIEEWIDNGYKFVELFDKYQFITANDRILLPNTEMVYNVKTDSRAVLDQLIAKYGLMPALDHPKYQVYKDRLEYEVSVLKDNGTADFLPYFFVVEDAASYCRSAKMLYNTRGSAGGCLVLFLLNISITDPIKYDLPFERFLTLGRIKSGSLPDIDFDVQERDPVIAYLYAKYGQNIGLISTDLLMRLKTSILDVERADKGYVPPEVSTMCTFIKGAQQGQSDVDWLFGYSDKDTGAHVPGFMDDMKDVTADQLRKYSQKNPELWKTVLKCIGIVKSRGVHAGGVVITPGPIQDYFPMIKSNKGLAVAYEMKALEACGGIKYDFLGVSTLKAMSITFKSIFEHTGVQLKWEEPPHQKVVFDKIIGGGKLAGIFQINTKTVKPGVEKLTPASVKEIANLTSLFRPGAMDSPSPDPKDPSSITAADYYIQCKRGEREMYLIHEDLRPILGHTYGIQLQQEQTIKIFQVLCGYSAEESEACRRAIGKKDKDLLELHSNKLKLKCLERGWSEEQAKRLMDSIMASSRYSFNASHAYSYAIVAYYGCWLKYNYPAHFWKGQLQISDADEIRALLPECGHLILDVSATKSHSHEWLIEGDKLRAPLSIVKQVGGAAADKLYSTGVAFNA